MTCYKITTEVDGKELFGVGANITQAWYALHYSAMRRRWPEMKKDDIEAWLDGDEGLWDFDPDNIGMSKWLNTLAHEMENAE